MTEKVTDDMLMALADGELDAATTARLRALLETDPALRQRYALFARSADAVREVYSDTLAEAPPARLVDALRAAPAQPGVVRMGPGQPASAPGWRWRVGSLTGLALAASLALGIGIGVLVTIQDDVGRPGGGLDGLRAAVEALGAHPTGVVVDLADGGRAAVLASFDTADGSCRQVQLRDAAGGVSEALGCHGPAGWEIALVLPQAARGGYVPAEGATSGALDAYLAAIGASPPLDADAEAARIGTGWAAAD